VTGARSRDSSARPRRRRATPAGFWWLNRERQHLEDVPESAYFASGAFGQTSLVIPSHDLVITRMGFSFPEDEALSSFAGAVVAAVESGGGGS
jgi:hypothetical protein